MSRNQASRIRMSAKAAIVVVLAVIVAALGMAVASPAQAYPPVSCSVTITPQKLVGGNPITVKGKSNVSEKWTVSFDGVTHHYVGKTFTDRYPTPKVQKKTVLRLIVHCSGSLGDQTLAYNVTLLPASTGKGVLPNTGGPDLWLFVAGFGALSLGAVLMTRRRRPSASGLGRETETRE
ncbi:MAG: LPXTG cell wall anchor domain-containing protein [Marmoricola sp.]